MKRQHAMAERMVVVIMGVCLGVATGLAQAPAAGGDGADWPQWRGPDRSGISKDTKWNAASVKDAKVAWKANVGDGYSSVVVKGPRLFTAGNRENKDIVWCLDAKTGAEVWKQSYACSKGDYPGPRATPAVDGDLVYMFSREGHITCLKASDGAIVWQKHAVADFQAKNTQWGFSSSPIIEGDLLLLNAGPCGLALNKKTGDKVWSSGPGVGGYSAAAVYTLNNKPAVTFFSQKSIRGADLKTGQELWSFPWETSYDVHAADPVVVGSQVFFTSGYGRGCALLDISGPEVKKIYENKTLCSQFSSTVFMDGHIYGITGNAGNGNLVCLDIKTGVEKWKQNLGFGSLIAVGDKLIVLNEKGSLFVADASPTGYKEVATAATVLSATCWTSPVFCRGVIYCRNHLGDLVAVDVSK